MDSISPKRIIISGWYGNKNLGDEAQLSSMVSMIYRVLPNAEITVFSDNPEATISEHHVNSVYRRKLNRLWELFKADLFILGGGTLLYDAGKSANPIGWLNDVIMSKLMGTPVMYFNGGVGLIYNRLSKYYMKRVCNAMGLITVRDELSKRYLTLVGITKPIYVGADSVFALTEQSIAEAKKYEKHTITEKPQVGVNVRPWLYKIEDIPPKNRALCGNFGGSSSDFVNFRKNLAGTIDYLKQEKGATVTFFPISFWKAKDEHDVELSEEIAQLLSDWDGVTVIRDECTYLKMINQIKQFDLVIGMRLHALIFAAMLNIPMLAISYDPKVDAFMKLIGQEEYLVSINEVTKEVLRKKINLLWEHREVVAKQLEKRVPEIASKSESSAELMVALLNTRRSRIKLVFEGIVLAIRVMPCILSKALLKPLRVVCHISKLPFCLKISFLFEKLKNMRRKKNPKK